MKNVYALTSIILIFTGIIVSSFVGVTLLTTSVLGANQTNATTLAKVYVWNTNPNITSVTVIPATLTGTPGNYTTVVCEAFVYDWNGWEDISNINATLHSWNVTYGGTEDYNNRYINNSCGNASTACGEIDATNASCNCTFRVWYFADNGTWTCNMTITDDTGNATERYRWLNGSNSGNMTVAQIIGIGSPDEIDYGNLSVTERSNRISANISNFGNVPINVTVRGYGGEDYDDQNNMSMICEYNNITQGYHRFTIANATSYENMNNLTNNSQPLIGGALELPVRTDDVSYGNDTNTTFWQIEVPLSVGGTCNGTIEFTATERPTTY